MVSAMAKLSQNILDLAGISVILLVSSLSMINEWGNDQFWLVSFLSLSVPVLFIAFITASSHSQRVISFTLQGTAMAALYILVNNSFIAIFSIVWIVQASEIFSTKKSVFILIASAAYYTSTQVYHSHEDYLVQTLISAASFGLFQVFAFGASQRAISERKMKEEAASLNRELLATRELLSQSAAQSERVRISRDLHDILGHHMTALILNLEVASHKTDGDAKEKVQQSLSLAKLLLGDIRTAVGELRHDDKINLEQSIIKLTEGIPNIEFSLDFNAAPEVKSIAVAETLLRCAQESITNTIKHSHSTHCSIILDGNPESCVLTIKDNGSSETDYKIGNGITGMTERVEALRGILKSSMSAEGFSVRVEIPLGESL